MRTLAAGLWLGLAACAACAACAAGAEFHPSDFGARGDGKTLDTAAIQKTIDAAAKRGGTVVLAGGTYLSGAVFLKSGVNLRIEEGATLVGSQRLADYPILETRVAGVEMKWPAALINVYQQHDVSLSGKGIADGDGKVWWDLYWKMRRGDYEPKGLRWAVDYDCQRPRLIQIYRSENVRVEGLTLKRSGFWTVHICYSRHVAVEAITIRNNEGGRGPSTDGVDIDSSNGITVANCDIECNDDAICLKAGRDADGLRVAKPTENVTIRDNTVRAGAAGVTFGSETSGGIGNVQVLGGRVLAGVPVGILFKSASTRGGTIDNIRIRDLVMEGVGTVFAVAFNWNPSYSYAKIPEGMKNVPSYWRVLAEPVPPEKGLPHLRNVAISDIRATGARQAFSVASYKDSPLANFKFDDWQIEVRSAGSIQNAENWEFTETQIHTADGSRVAVKDSTGVTGLP